MPSTVATLDTAPDLPHVEADTARLMNWLTCRAAPVPLRLAGHDWRARFVPPDAAIAARSAQGYAFTLGTRHGRICLDVASERTLLGVPGAAEALPVLLRHAIMADACADVAAAVAAVQPDPLTWHPAPAAWPSNLAALGVELTRPGATPLRAVLQFESPERLAALPAAPAARSAPWLADLPAPLAVRIGTTTITVGEMRGIEPGDIVSIERWQSQAGALVVRCATGQRGMAWTAVAEGRRVTALDDITFLHGAHMADAHPEGHRSTGEPGTPADIPHPDAAQATLSHLDGLEVELRFEVGDVAVPLAELRAVKPGYVFELPQPLKQSEVRIVVNGNRIGTGTLIAVGNRLGVRVATFAAGDA